jgi:opacity protein-like surface antigen
MRKSLVAAAIAAAALSLAPSAAQATQRVCSSADLRFPFQPGQPKRFGVFALTVDGGSCVTAHGAAEAWAAAYEANVAKGRVRAPKSAGGFTFTTLPAKAAQELRQRGRRGGVTVRFAYRVPNG